MNLLKVTKFLHKLASQDCPDWCGEPETGLCNSCQASALLMEPNAIEGDAHLQEGLDLTAQPCGCGNRLSVMETMTCGNCGGTI